MRSCLVRQGVFFFILSLAVFQTIAFAHDEELSAITTQLLQMNTLYHYHRYASPLSSPGMVE